MIYWHVDKPIDLHLCPAQALFIVGSRRNDRGRAAPLHRHGGRTAICGQSRPERGGICFLPSARFFLLPRLKAIARQKLYLPYVELRASLDNLDATLTRPIDWELIARQYDERVKFATALRERTAEPEPILRRFTRSNVKHPTCKAPAELGKVIKNTFLCDYLGSEGLRREIHEGLNVVGRWNGTFGCSIILLWVVQRQCHLRSGGCYRKICCSRMRRFVTIMCPRSKVIRAEALSLMAIRVLDHIIKVGMERPPASNLNCSSAGTLV